jgi:hypothetical protein
MTDTQTLITEAQELGLFRPQAAFEVHCSNCHGRLDGRGDCPTCGLIGRNSAELERRAQTDPEGTSKLLRNAIDKRKNFKPVGARGEKSQER